MDILTEQNRKTDFFVNLKGKLYRMVKSNIAAYTPNLFLFASNFDSEFKYIHSK